MNIDGRRTDFDPRVLHLAQELSRRPSLIPIVLDAMDDGLSKPIPALKLNSIADILGESAPDIMGDRILQAFLQENPSVLTTLSQNAVSGEDLKSCSGAAKRYLESRVYWSFEETDQKISEFLGARAEAMRSFATTGKLPESVSTFYDHGHRESRLPAYPVGNKPCLLLHNLQDQSEDAKDLFSGTKNVLLINATGCGKSRIVLAGLCNKWGFYFVCGHQANLSPVLKMGSGDLNSLITKTIPHHPAYSASPSSTDKKKFLRNSKVARRCFRAAILARLLVMEWFLHACRGANSMGFSKEEEEVYRHRWLLLQVFPSLLGPIDDDVFDSLTSELLHAPDAYLWARIDQARQRIKTLLTGEPLYCVVDEAQLGSYALKGDFCSDSNSELRSSLCEIFKGWTEAIKDVVYVITGTGINRREMIEALSSVMLKNGDIVIRYHTGGFEDYNVQSNYVRQFLPEEYCNSYLGKALLHRIWWWLRGRYRNTTAFVEALLEVGFEHAHKLLTEYVKYSACFRPTDGDDFIRDETKEHRQSKSSGCDYCADERGFEFCHHVVDFGVVFRSTHPRLHFGLADIIYPMITHARRQGDGYITAPDEQLDFIRHGIARVEGKKRLKDMEDDRLDNVTINEPLTLGLAVNFLKAHQTQFQPWSARNMDKNHKTPGEANGFETYLALYFALQFAQWRPLSEVFRLIEIRDDQRTLLDALRSAKARLVARFSIDGVVVDAYPSFKDVVITGSDFNIQRLWSGSAAQAPSTSTKEDRYSTGAAIQLGCLGSESGHLFEWINGELGIPICFPGTMIGPDLMLCLELRDPTNHVIDGKRIWVAVQAKHYDTDRIGPDDFLKALSRVSPSRMCTQVVQVRDSDNEMPRAANPRAHLSRQAKAEPAPIQAGGRQPTKRQLQKWKTVELEISGKKENGNAAIRSGFAKLPKRLSLQSFGLGPDDFTVLRVVAAFPSQTPETIRRELVKKDPLCKSDNHPIAILNREHFIDADKSGILKQLAARHRDKHSQLHPPSKRRRPNDSDMEVD